MTSSCKYCRKPIYWQNVTGLWVPYEDQTHIIKHQCRKQQETIAATQPTIKAGPFTDQEIVILKKLVHNLVM